MTAKPKARRAKALTSPTGAQKTRAWRANNVAEGFCQNGKEHDAPTRGKLCQACLEQNYAIRKNALDHLTQAARIARMERQ